MKIEGVTRVGDHCRDRPSAAAGRRVPLACLTLGAALVVAALGGRAAERAVQVPVFARSAPVLRVDGLRFKDLDRNGRLDPYENWRLTPDERAADLIKRMTLAEKVGLMMHAAVSGFMGPGGQVLREPVPPVPGAPKSVNHVRGVPGFDPSDKPSPYDLMINKHVRWINTSPGGSPADVARWANALQQIAEAEPLGIPVMLSSDPIETRNRMPGGGVLPPGSKRITSSWPDEVGMAATGDPVLVLEFARIAAAEYRAMGFRQILGPMADLATEPRWNRITGTFGAEAGLSAELVAAYVRGFQGKHLGPQSVLTCVKHFPGDGPVQNGFDPHNPYGKYLVYPSHHLWYHLIPFRAGIAAGTASIMGSYGIPTGIDTAGANFSKVVITDMLRRKLGFHGIVLTDWLRDMPWGVEDLGQRDRELRLIEAGVDQLGGEHDPSYLISLVKAGRISERRIDESVRRILIPMFALGMFEDPYDDPARAAAIVDNPVFRAAGEDAQRRAIVLLKNAGGVLPLDPREKLFLSGFSRPPATLAARVVSSIAAADVAIVKVDAPYVLRTDGTSFFTVTHEGTLAYTGSANEGDLERIRSAVRSGKPVIVVMSMERPAVLGEFIGSVAGMIATFGSDDAAVADILTGRVAPTGRLPFDLPADMAAVESHPEDSPDDFARTQLHAGFGLTYRRKPLWLQPPMRLH